MKIMATAASPPSHTFEPHLGHAALLGEQLQHTPRGLLQQFKALSVVREGDVGKLDLLLPILERKLFRVHISGIDNQKAYNMGVNKLHTYT